MIMKIVDGLLQMILETGPEKEIFVYLKSQPEPLQGIVTALDPNKNSILIESTDETETLCFLVNLKDISYMSYFKCNGFERNDVNLENDIELTEIFPDGIVPLKSPVAGRGRGREEEPIRFYEVDISKLSEDQVNRIFERFEEMGLKFNPEEFFNEGYRILTKHFSGIAFDSLKYLI